MAAAKDEKSMNKREGVEMCGWGAKKKDGMYAFEQKALKQKVKLHTYLRK